MTFTAFRLLHFFLKQSPPKTMLTDCVKLYNQSSAMILMGIVMVIHWQGAVKTKGIWCLQQVFMLVESGPTPPPSYTHLSYEMT